ncbi:MAG: GGDEF domain-containing protein [Burkholderiaceae bacterium]|nr:GGDEF domain-containing protein [Burkholderiaceae bacterium]
MSAHIPTLLAMIVLISLIMALSIAVVGSERKRDGLGWWSAALLLNAVGHFLFMLRGQVPDAFSVVLANVLLSSVLTAMVAAVAQFQGRSLPWWALAIPSATVGFCTALFSSDYWMRVASVGVVLAVQSLWTLSVAVDRRYVAPGRGLWLMVAGLSTEAVILGNRAWIAAFSRDSATNILQSSILQTLTFVGSVVVVLVCSLGFVFMLRDRADENNRRLAALDPLTGVANRRLLLSALYRDIARALRIRAPLAVLMVDIDHFKKVNDQHGHLVGDAVLCHVVSVLRANVREQDVVGRYGGEEFLLLLADTSLQGAVQLAELLREAAEATPYPLASAPGGAIAVTVSIGVFGAPLQAGDTAERLIDAADRALYRAKELGRNRVEVAGSLPCLVENTVASRTLPTAYPLL